MSEDIYSTTPPTKPGFYWWRHGPGGQESVQHVYRSLCDDRTVITGRGGEWGPRILSAEDIMGVNEVKKWCEEDAADGGVGPLFHAGYASAQKWVRSLLGVTRKARDNAS